MARIINPNSFHRPEICIFISYYNVCLTLFYDQNGFKVNKVSVLTSLQKYLIYHKISYSSAHFPWINYLCHHSIHWKTWSSKQKGKTVLEWSNMQSPNIFFSFIVFQINNVRNAILTILWTEYPIMYLVSNVLEPCYRHNLLCLAYSNS